MFSDKIIRVFKSRRVQSKFQWCLKGQKRVTDRYRTGQGQPISIPKDKEIPLTLITELRRVIIVSI